MWFSADFYFSGIVLVHLHPCGLAFGHLLDRFCKHARIWRSGQQFSLFSPVAADVQALLFNVYLAHVCPGSQHPKHQNKLQFSSGMLYWVSLLIIYNTFIFSDASFLGGFRFYIADVLLDVSYWWGSSGYFRCSFAKANSACCPYGPEIKYGTG